VIKFFSLSEFLENTKFGLQKLQERTALFQARAAQFAERSRMQERFCSTMHEYKAVLQASAARSVARVSRERIRLETQSSCTHPVLTRREEDAIERESDTSQFEVISLRISEEYTNFRSRRQIAQDDRAQNFLIQEQSSRALAAQSSSNQHVEWIFDALSSCKVGS
jgi:hypothetical protein